MDVTDMTNQYRMLQRVRFRIAHRAGAYNRVSKLESESMNMPKDSQFESYMIAWRKL